MDTLIAAFSGVFMLYTVSRNGQTYGPYTLEDLQRYVGSGNVLPTDLAKTEEMSDWLPVSQILGTQSTMAEAMPGSPVSSSSPQSAGYGGASNVNTGFPAAGLPNAALAASQYPDPPKLHWGLVLLFTFLTCGIFIYIWDVVQGAWMKKVQTSSTALFYYIGACVVLVLYWIASFANGVSRGLSGAGGSNQSPIALLLLLVLAVLVLVGRFSLRASLEQHFNGPENIGLALSGVMTFFFGALYFQYHLSRIAALKQAARYGAPRAY